MQVVVAGVTDDIRPITPLLKLAIQIVASGAIVFLAQGVLLPLGSGPWHLLFALGWIVLIINGINLLDNIDGLAADTALIASLTVTIVQWTAGHGEMALLFLGLSATLSGFLVLNVNPAKLFMGDAGSLWAGLLIGCGSLSLVEHSTEPLTDSVLKWLLPLALCALPLLDTTMVSVTRWRRGQSVMLGGRDHLSHRLVRLGYSERLSVFALWVTGALGTSVALAMLYAPIQVWGIWLSAFAMSAGGLTLWIGSLPIEENPDRRQLEP